MFPTSGPGLLAMMQAGWDPRQWVQGVPRQPQDDRSDQVPRGNQSAPNAMGQPMGAVGGPGPDPRGPSPPDQNYDPNVVKQRNNMLNMGMMGLQMLQPQRPGSAPPWLQIGNKRY